MIMFHSRGLRPLLTCLSLAWTVAGGAWAQEPPKTAYWHPWFSVEFNETTKLPFYERHTTGSWHYNAYSQQELMIRSNGRGDRYCLTLHPFTDTPCHHLVTGGKRYLIFPELNSCCMCCTAEQGCGALRPDWLAGAALVGPATILGRPAWQWAIKGLQTNYYYSSADVAQVPLELDQLPNALMSMDPDTFQPWAPEPSLFDVPPGCADRCPTTSICTLLAARAPQQQHQQQQQQQQAQPQPAASWTEPEKGLLEWDEDEDGIHEQYSAVDTVDAEDIDRWEARQYEEEVRQQQALWEEDWPGPGWVEDMEEEVEAEMMQHRETAAAGPASTPAAAAAAGQGGAQRPGGVRLPGMAPYALA